VIANRAVFDRAGEAVMAKINANERAARALEEGAQSGEKARPAIAAHHAPDLKSAG